MRAVQVLSTTGPDGVAVADIPDPVSGPDEVLIAVEAVGVCFPDLLLSRAQYQIRPEPPFTLGVDLAGTVLAPAASGAGGFSVGQRVAGVISHGAAAERVSLAAEWVFPLPGSTTLEQGAAIPLNYLTAHFALAVRGQVKAGDTVLVHGASGGVGSASLQVARGLGARAIGVVSTKEKADFALAAGADDVVLIEGFKDAVLSLTGGVGVDAVVDVVGGDVFTDSLRVLGPQGRILVVGFAAGQGIPEVKVNRLLLNNTDVRGVGWGAYAMARPGYLQEQWAALEPMLTSGVISPPIGATYAFADFGQALRDMDERRTLGKSVVLVAS